MLRSRLQTLEFAEGLLQHLDIELRAQREMVELVDPLEAFELEDDAECVFDNPSSVANTGL
ncbi:hypothetical protein CCR95_14945 [Thiocystis minor]|nr:hypothetical protein [Thiocystis minor]